MSSSENLKIPLLEILSATNRFDETNLIAKGGFGNVYRGESEQRGLLAIKKLDRAGGQGAREFGMEVQLLSAYKHDHLVSLVGYCDEGGEKILVYKYETNGSLDRYLLRKDPSWMLRLQICIDAARGLSYLHHEVGPEHGFIHRDIKSSNILLDENLKAKISDFGLSKLALKNMQFSIIYSTPCGTPGYVDPEYLHGALTQKSDVYSFGIVLFEVLLGKLVTFDPKYLNQDYFLVETALNHYQRNTLDKIIKPDLLNQMHPASLSTFSTIARQCLMKDRKDRPTMKSVLEALEKALIYQQAPSGRFAHDVYISLRDQDVSNYFVEELCATLESEGLSPYKGNMKRFRKESLLLKAIEQSRSFIIIFSKSFAANSWNLDEVAKIMECAKERTHVVIIPIFYEVYRSEVRTQTGFFGEAMSKYEFFPKMEVWRNALVQATNLAGLQDDLNCWPSSDFAKVAAAEIKRQSLGKIYDA